MISKPDTGLGVKGILVKRNQVLVLQKVNGMSDLPGGKVEPGESLEDALIREISEETRLTVEIKAPIYSWSFIKDGKSLIKGWTFLCLYKSGEVILSSEHTKHWWSKLDRLDQIPLNRYVGQMTSGKILAPAFSQKSLEKGVDPHAGFHWA
ncbi:MAG: NUDIX hydrolase [Thermodesulfobacteriota bacterium]|jgi:8-oxo-dGTP pyrophosphatase MutT (NUDIX family)